MKVIHLNTKDISGGAARGSYWLHRGLIDFGIDSQILVKDKMSDDNLVSSYETKLEKYFDKIRGILDLTYLLPYKQRKEKIFSPSKIGKKIHHKIEKINPDLIHLHYVCGGFLSIKEIGIIGEKRPFVWTLRDMWPFTGGCHYSGDCEKYLDSCGDCPHLQSFREKDLSRSIWNQKKIFWEKINPTIVAISEWLANCTKNSSLFKNYRIEVIHNALDEKKYKPIDKSFARDILNLPQNKKIILFGAMKATIDKRKGFDYLVDALKNTFLCNQENIELVVFGSSQSVSSLDLNMNVTFLGQLYDDITLALVYSAGDVMVVPSIEEAFGKTAMESLACGTPVVSFDSTGLKDIVEHKQNGYRAECFSSQELAQGILWVLEDDHRWQKLSENARKTVEEKFTLKIQAEKYYELYKDILSQHV